MSPIPRSLEAEELEPQGSDSSWKQCNTTVSLFVPFRPMLAHRIEADDIDTLFKDTPTYRSLLRRMEEEEGYSEKKKKEPGLEFPEYLLEPKFDGERLLCHVDKRSGKRLIKLFTRRSTDYTNNYGIDLSSTILDGLK